MQISSQHTKPKTGKKLLLILILTIIAAGCYGAYVYFENEKPSLSFQSEIQFLGKSPQFSILAEDKKSGLKSITLTLLQDNKEHLLYEKSFQREGYKAKAGPNDHRADISFDLKKFGIKEGEAELIITAKDFSMLNFFQGNVAKIQKKVVVDTIPPTIKILHSERYIKPGQSGIVIYQLDGDAEAHGVLFGDTFFPGHLIGDGRDDVYIAYMGTPYNTKTIKKSLVKANDAAGNERVKSFYTIFKNRPPKKDTIRISDGFLSAKIPEFESYYPVMKGSMLEKYIYANNSIRKENNQQIKDLCKKATPERLWEGKFNRMAGASKAGFAEHRTYYYKGKEIDKQVHLGMDIASTRRASVKAANRGKVVFADYLGIYGNMVLLDHGQGIYSLYSHLSRIMVDVGDIIEKDNVLGQTGKSGMAGGDHLHFSMLVNGVFVTPKEWWDPNWIEVTIESPIVDSKF